MFSELLAALRKRFAMLRFSALFHLQSLQEKHKKAQSLRCYQAEEKRVLSGSLKNSAVLLEDTPTGVSGTFTSVFSNAFSPNGQERKIHAIHSKAMGQRLIFQRAVGRFTA